MKHSYAFQRIFRERYDLIIYANGNFFLLNQAKMVLVWWNFARKNLETSYVDNNRVTAVFGDGNKTSKHSVQVVVKTRQTL